MKGHSLIEKLSVLVIPVILLAPLAANAEAPTGKDLTLFFMHVRGGTCDLIDPTVGMITMTTPANTLLFNRNDNGPITCTPVLAPDGHQLTLGEFTTVKGTATVKCTNKGTHSVLHLSGLQPKGVYTAWLIFADPSGMLLGAGVLGTSNPIENYFTASASGEGQLVVTTPAQNLSILGAVGACWLDVPAEVHLVLHSDNQTHGPEPGPTETWVVIGRFLFP